MTQLRQRVERLEHAETTSVQYGATANDLANFPGMMNLAAGDGITLTPAAGTLTVSTDWIGANSGTDYADASTSLSADATWYDTGASVSLAAGTYLVTTFANGFIRTAGGALAGITTRLYNTTDAAAVASSECLLLSDLLAVRGSGSSSLSMIVTVAGTKTLRLEALRLTATYASVPVVESNTSGRSGITYVRIA